MSLKKELEAQSTSRWLLSFMEVRSREYGILFFH
jgi:hypothetical protein